MSTLFSSFTLGRITLPNRVVMSPMTRCRAIGNLPNEMMAKYYEARASAGLIVTEGTAPSPNGLGYARIPGCYSPAQIAGWRGITDAVHAAGGRIVLQLMHTGRVGHAHNLPAGARVVAPSAVAAPGTMYTDVAGPQPHPVPEAMNDADIAAARDEFVHAARSAIAAGFDGVELHGANGYLIEQFLNTASNQRTDGYGKTVAGRSRFALETVRAVADAIGAERLGMRVSPYGANGGIVADADTDAVYTHLAAELSKLEARVHPRRRSLGDGRAAGQRRAPGDAARDVPRRVHPQRRLRSRARRGGSRRRQGRSHRLRPAVPRESEPRRQAAAQRRATRARSVDAFFTPGERWRGYIDWPAD